MLILFLDYYITMIYGLVLFNARKEIFEDLILLFVVFVLLLYVLSVMFCVLYYIFNCIY